MKIQCMVTEVNHATMYDGRVVNDARITLRVVEKYITPEFIQEISKLAEKIHCIELDTKDFISF